MPHTALALLLLLAQQPVTAPDPPSTQPAPDAVAADPAPAADPDEASAPARAPDAPAATSAPANAETPPAESADADAGDEADADSDAATVETTASPAEPAEQAPPPPPGDPATAAAPPPAPEPAQLPDSPGCPSSQLATPLIYTGAGIGGVGLLGAVGFAIAAIVERSQAQALLDRSPAFGKVGDSYVVRQPGDPDVAAYDGHRASASVLGQLGWIALGLSTTGAAIAGTAALLASEAEGCQTP